MARDSKSDSKPAAPRAAGRPGMHPMLAGILIGLLLGITLALGIAIWLNRASSPFIEKAKPVEALPTLPAKPAAGKTEGTAPTEAAGDKPRFDFYKILPGEKEGNAKRAPDAPPAKSEAKTDAKADTKPAADAKTATDSKPATAASKPVEDVKAAHKDSVYLQAGAFQNNTDAENLKAKIAFAGMEALVRPVNLADKGTLYRVRLGPYPNAEEANRIKNTLSQSGIATTVVKGD